MRHGLGASQLSIVTLSTRDGAQINIRLRGEGEQRFMNENDDEMFFGGGVFHRPPVIKCYRPTEKNADDEGPGSGCTSAN